MAIRSVIVANPYNEKTLLHSDKGQRLFSAGYLRGAKNCKVL